MSKGSNRRPQQADDNHVSSEWDRLCGNNKSSSNKPKNKKIDRYEFVLNDSGDWEPKIIDDTNS